MKKCFKKRGTDHKILKANLNLRECQNKTKVPLNFLLKELFKVILCFCKELNSRSKSTLLLSHINKKKKLENIL